MRQASGGVQSQPPHLDFLARAQGTLPETIAATDLDTLNMALGFFFARLREARRQFEEERDGGRVGAFTALAATWMFISMFRDPLQEHLQVPILRLQDALAALDNNLVEPMLKPIPRPGRAASSHAHAALKGHAAGTVTRLLQAGLERQEAHKAVAKLLAKLGIRPKRGSGGVTATTVRNWCDEVASDVGRHSTAAICYDQMFDPAEEERFRALPKDRAKRFAQASLEAWVRKVFPVSEKPS
jgi:hypothetical protein